MRREIAIICTIIGCSSIAVCSATASPKAESFGALFVPAENFIKTPQGFSIQAEASGDLNGDGRLDKIIIFRGRSKSDGSMYSRNLCIFEGQLNKKLKVATCTDHLTYDSEEPGDNDEYLISMKFRDNGLQISHTWNEMHNSGSIRTLIVKYLNKKYVVARSRDEVNDIKGSAVLDVDFESRIERATSICGSEPESRKLSKLKPILIDRFEFKAFGAKCAEESVPE